MAEDSDLERTEAATSKRLGKAREQGDVPRSREASTCLLLLLGGTGIWLFSDNLGASLRSLMTSTFSFDRAQAFDAGLMADILADHGSDVLLALAPIAAIMLMAAVASPLLLGGFLFNASAIMPKFGKLNPVTGIGNMFSINSLVELGKAVAKALLIGTLAWLVIRGQLDAMLGLGVESLKTSSSHLAQMIWHAFLVMTSGLLLIAMIDVPYQMWHYADKLKMTKDQVKQEHRENEGDPKVKGKIRQLQRAMARRRMMADVPTADVVVTNPSHYAVALKYSDSMGAPKVVAKGSDAVALRIRELAKQNKVPIMEAPPLARALHFHAEIGDQIPESLYTAVAEVLAYVFQLNTFNKEGGHYPKQPQSIPVPSELDPLDPDYLTAVAAKRAEKQASKQAAKRAGSVA